MNVQSINPKIDFVFRRIFGSEENKDVLISLINSVIEPDIHIVDLSIKNPFNLAAYRKAKGSILDIKAVDQNGIWYDIEMQIAPHSLYGKRYLSKLYTDQLEAGDDYSNLNMTIGIHFLDFRYFDDDRIVRQFAFKDVETNEVPSELASMRLYFVEMAKFNKDWPELRTALDRWIAFLNKAIQLRRGNLPVELQVEPAIVKAATELERIGLSAEEREIYEAEVKTLMVDQIQLKDAEKRGVQQTLLRQLTRRIGQVPPSVATKLRSLTAGDLDELSDAIFDLNTYADVETWLTKH